MAKSRQTLKNELSKKHSSWTNQDLEKYINGYYDGIMEYMRLLDQVKQGEYNAIITYKKEQ